jgi:inner membrane protein
VDSFTHGLLAFYLLTEAGLPGAFLVPVVIGAIFPDIDILFHRLSDYHPRLFIFTHGGFTHSVAGTIVIAVLLTLFTAVLSLTGLQVPAIGFTLLAAYLVGSLVHIGLDILAYPGIPVFYPFSSQKHTVGIFPGPSLFIFGVTGVFLLLVALGLQTLMNPVIYLIVVIGFIAFRAVMKAAVVIVHQGITIPRLNPFSWFIIHENDSTYTLESYRVLGETRHLGQYPKYQSITRENLTPYLHLPEVQRHLYYSYISVVTLVDGTITFFDPLREEKYVWYPPEYVRVQVPIKSIPLKA